MTTALSHLRYLVSDFTPVLHFYRDVLRLKLAVDVPGVYAEFETPGGHVGGSWFPACWVTRGLGIGQQLTFWERPAAAPTLGFEEAQEALT